MPLNSFVIGMHNFVYLKKITRYGLLGHMNKSDDLSIIKATIGCEKMHTYVCYNYRRGSFLSYFTKEIYTYGKSFFIY